jgi:hypothetical protein
MINQANHKSADNKPSVVNKLLLKDVTHGFSLLLPPETITRIQGALVQPLGLAKQWSLNQHGDRIPKYRLAQDLSFSITQNACSINDQIDMKEYAEMIHGWCLGRILHFIIAIRLAHLGKRICKAKYDNSHAYRCIAHSGSAATDLISIFDRVAYVALRLTFGGSTTPPTWCLFSEMVTDLANKIYCCSPWDPAKLHSPAQPNTRNHTLPPQIGRPHPRAPFPHHGTPRPFHMNRLTIWQPTRLSFSDTCPFGFGGYNLHGRAWRICIPPPLPPTRRRKV